MDMGCCNSELQQPMSIYSFFDYTTFCLYGIEHSTARLATLIKYIYIYIYIPLSRLTLVYLIVYTRVFYLYIFVKSKSFINSNPE